MHKWKYAGINTHIFTYDRNTAWISCSCGQLGTRVSGPQSIPTAERHIRNRTRNVGSLVIQDLSDVTRTKN